MHRWRSVVAVAVFLALVAGVGAAVSVLDRARSDGAEPPGQVAASAWRGFVGGARPRVALGQRVIVLLRAPSLAERVRLAGGRATEAAERRWTAIALASQQQFLAELAEKGVVAKPGLRFTRVVNGFSAIADPGVVALLERSPQVVGVYPVRAAFPAAAGIGTNTAVSPMPAELAGFPGRGVAVALLDTAVDPATPYLHERVMAGFDVVSGGVAARYDQRPGGRRLETHGTIEAGIVVGRAREGRPAGIAPEATLIPIRVAGWQQDAAGRWAVYARTDQVVAGLERAVDPDGDGDAHDAARVTLLPLVAPFAAFDDDPLARAIRGATALDSLVVAPAGNDGPGGPVFGSIAGPGGAPAALTVGAVDLRGEIHRVPVLVRSGARVLLRRPLDVVTVTELVPETVEIVPVRRGDVFDKEGRSRVAGRAALLAGHIEPRRDAKLAADAGAAVVVIAGGELPAGALGLDPGLAVPVLTAGPELAGVVQAERNAGRTVWLSTGQTRRPASRARGAPASFSSWGLAFGGHLKPEIAAPGVGVVSVTPSPDGRPRLITASGASAATAVAAGLAAWLAEARPALDADGLRSALVGTARPIARATPMAQGMGVVSANEASSAELVVTPATVSFGRGSGDGWTGRQKLRLRNLSTRDLTVYLAVEGAGSDLALDLSRGHVKVPAGGSVEVVVRARLLGVSGDPLASGIVRVAPRDGVALDVPWTLVLAPVPGDLIGEAVLSEHTFSPSDLTPVVLAVQIGTVRREAGRDTIEPARRFDVLLQNARGRTLGLLARLRDVLPGQYAFGITGRGPGGKSLSRGEYRLRLAAWPAAGGKAVVRTVAFRIR